MLRGAFSRFSLKNLFFRKKSYPTPKKDVDMRTLDEFTLKVNAMSKISPDNDHPIHSLSQNGRSLISTTNPKSKSPIIALDVLDKYLLENFTKLQSNFEADVSVLEPKSGSSTPYLANKTSIEAAIRLYLARQYFRRLRKACDDKDLDIKVLDTPLLQRLLDVVMRGTASERIEAHMHLYGPELNQERLQECFYSLYEPEVHTCAQLFLLNAAVHKHHRKNMPKFARTYLLDKAELNVKLRCVLAWSGM